MTTAISLSAGVVARILVGFKKCLVVISTIVFLALSTAQMSAQTSTFVNSTPITIADNSTATPFYPSDIVATGVSNRVTKVVVTLNGFAHTRPDDVGILLVGPAGQKVRLMTDVGGSTAVASPINVPFDDRGALSVPNNAAITGVIHKPTAGTNNVGNAHPANFPAPAPAGPYSLRLSDLIGTVPNGTWRLYINDDTVGNQGTINLGWTLNITTGGVFTNPAPITINDALPATPYPSTISTAGFNGSVTKVTVRLNALSHSYLDDAAFLLVGPTGAAVRLSTDSGGSNGVTNIDVLLDDSSANALPDSTAFVSTSYRPRQGTVFEAGAHPANFPAPAPVNPYSNVLSSFNGSNANGTWSLYVNDDTGADAGSLAGGWTLTIESSAPTAAGAAISGRVATPEGYGLSKVTVKLLGGNLSETVVAVTDPQGFYRFENIASGQTYVLTVSSRRFRFPDPVRVINLSDDLAELDFISSP